jgi:hypothetical protein
MTALRAAGATLRAARRWNGRLDRMAPTRDAVRPVSKSPCRDACSACATSCSYSLSTSVLLTCANATCIRCGELSAARAGRDSGMRPSVEIGPARVRTPDRTVDAGARRKLCRQEARSVPAARPFGRSIGPLPHAGRPFVSSGCPRAGPAPKVQPSKTSRRRCNLKEPIMNTPQQSACTCNTCPGTGCTCGCQQAAAQAACACGPQCPCGPQCRCSAGASGAQS